ncbi:hypothetical protein SeLEV6574_g07949 [Synchytrium endobioticum]|uniref:DNA mismatch repair protein PMS1 n=1 Tax=Synchytrium endobioticum TaxID=286115 RepID=A0A507CI10_9FUNG|nr:hypothetical protein SeLEV6574_g07949 [Synchytrium endobioticum]
MASINALDKSSIHRICSGQVILDLATAIKELVENALDASATSIEVRLKDSGLDGVEVIDNGHGISEENHNTIGLKHHTSKIVSFNDVYSLATYGFRGEAVSSLCAISNVVITTATAEDAPKGTRLELDANGKVVKNARVPREKGTTIAVKNLFETLPVRSREFRKNIKKEVSRTLDVLQGYGVVATGVRLSCWNSSAKGDKQIMFATSGNIDIKDNIANIYGNKMLGNLMKLDFVESVQDGPPIKFQGYMSKPSFNCGRNTSDRQCFYVNKRPFDSVKFTKAANEVYKTFNSQQCPVLFLNVTLNTDAYDVNLTPDKRMIIFHDEDLLLELFKTKLVQALEPMRGTLLLQPKLFISNASPSSTPTNATQLSRSESSSTVASSGFTGGHVIDIEVEDEDVAMGEDLDDDEPVVDERMIADESDDTDMHQDVGDQANSSHIAAVFSSTPLDLFASTSQTLASKTASPLPKQSSIRKSSPAKRGMMPLPRKPLPTLVPSRSKTINAFNETRSKLSANSRRGSGSDGEPPSKRPMTDHVGDMDVAVLEVLNQEVTFECSLGDLASRVSNLSRFCRKKMLNDNSNSRTEESRDDRNRKFNTGIGVEEEEQVRNEFNKYIHKEDFRKMEILGQFNLGFVIARLDDDLFIIDQHASDEKYNYEDLQRNLRLEGQRLLAPQPLPLTVQQEFLVMDHLDVFRRNGFDIEVNAGAPAMHRLKLLSCPFVKNKLFGVTDVEEIISKLSEGGPSTIRPSRIDALIASKACRKSVMIGMALEKSMMVKIVGNMSGLDQPWVRTVPMGAPR